MKINGKWYFNEVLNFDGVDNDKFMIDVTFESKGESFKSIEYNYDKGRFAYWTTDDIVKSVYSFGSSKIWTDEAYRTIDFGAAYQEVSDDFYNWLTANAVQLSKPIPMTHPKGIKLLTKGHKLSKDIEVVPTFAAAETVDITINADQSSIGAFTVLEDGKISTLYIDDVSDFRGTTLKVIKNSVFYISNYIETTLSDGELLGEGIYKATANATLTITH